MNLVIFWGILCPVGSRKIETEKQESHKLYWYASSENVLGLKVISLICDKSVTTQNLAFLSYWYRKKRLQMHF